MRMDGLLCMEGRWNKRWGNIGNGMGVRKRVSRFVRFGGAKRAKKTVSKFNGQPPQVASGRDMSRNSETGERDGRGQHGGGHSRGIDGGVSRCFVV